MNQVVRAAEQYLEFIAAKQATTAEELLHEAHTTRDSQPFHVEALSLERQLVFLLSQC